jgi:hypothetical protein
MIATQEIFLIKLRPLIVIIRLIQVLQEVILNQSLS